MQVRRRDALASRTVRFEYTVSGETRFPLDMLRIDGSYPAAASDVASITQSLRDRPTGRLIINLLTVRDTNWLPVQSRWRSFGWRVE